MIVDTYDDLFVNVRVPFLWILSCDLIRVISSAFVHVLFMRKQTAFVHALFVWMIECEYIRVIIVRVHVMSGPMWHIIRDMRYATCVTYMCVRTYVHICVVNTFIFISCLPIRDILFYWQSWCSRFVLHPFIHEIKDTTYMSIDICDVHVLFQLIRHNYLLTFLLFIVCSHVRTRIRDTHVCWHMNVHALFS